MITWTKNYTKIRHLERQYIVFIDRRLQEHFRSKHFINLTARRVTILNLLLKRGINLIKVSWTVDVRYAANIKTFYLVLI